MNTQHLKTGVANLTQNCKELLLMTPLTFPLMETVLNTASGKQSLGYSSLDTELHNDPHGSSLDPESFAHSLDWLLEVLMVSVVLDYLKKACYYPYTALLTKMLTNSTSDSDL